jgi:hypothetical protein
VFRYSILVSTFVLAAACVPTEQQAESGDGAAAPVDPRPANKRIQPPVRGSVAPRRVTPPRAEDATTVAMQGDAALAIDAALAAPAARLPSRTKPGSPAAVRPLPGVGTPPQPVAAIPEPPKPAAAPPDGAITTAYWDAFDRPELGAEWNPTSPEWRIQAGRLCGKNAKNHPVWLKRKLPVNARIEFDAVSTSPDGDLKVELWGDGQSFAKGTSYNDATSYLAIFGGWKNQFHVLARLDEHAKDRPEVKVNQANTDPRARPVQPGASYHFKIERTDGKTVHWFVDDIEVIAFTDKAPLKGAGHEHLGFNDWDAQVCFDNLQVTPLPGG